MLSSIVMCSNRLRSISPGQSVSCRKRNSHVCDQYSFDDHSRAISSNQSDSMRYRSADIQREYRSSAKSDHFEDSGHSLCPYLRQMRRHDWTGGLSLREEDLFRRRLCREFLRILFVFEQESKVCKQRLETLIQTTVHWFQARPRRLLSEQRGRPVVLLGSSAFSSDSLQFWCFEILHGLGRRVRQTGWPWSVRAYVADLSKRSDSSQRTVSFECEEILFSLLGIERALRDQTVDVSDTSIQAEPHGVRGASFACLQ